MLSLQLCSLTTRSRASAAIHPSSSPCPVACTDGLHPILRSSEALEQLFAIAVVVTGFAAYQVELELSA